MSATYYYTRYALSGKVYRFDFDQEIPESRGYVYIKPEGATFPYQCRPGKDLFRTEDEARAAVLEMVIKKRKAIARQLTRLDKPPLIVGVKAIPRYA